MDILDKLNMVSEILSEKEEFIKDFKVYKKVSKLLAEIEQNYIEKHVKKDCVFCDKSKIKSKVIEVENCYIFQPLKPVVEGHLLVVNKHHTKDFTTNSQLFGETCKVASEIAREMGGDYNLITSKGKNATQSVFHTHIHLIPRHEKDGVKLPWSKPDIDVNILNLQLEKFYTHPNSAAE